MKKLIYVDVSKMTFKEACYALRPKGISLYKIHVWTNVSFVIVVCSMLALVYFRY